MGNLLDVNIAGRSKRPATSKRKTSKEVELREPSCRANPFRGFSARIALGFEPKVTHLLSLLFLFIFLAACVPTTPAPVGEATILPRLLATVYLSPTPEGGEAQAAVFQPRATVSPTITATPSWSG